MLPGTGADHPHHADIGGPEEPDSPHLRNDGLSTSVDPITSAPIPSKAKIPGLHPRYHFTTYSALTATLPAR